jgi:hypothetical protein
MPVAKLFRETVIKRAQNDPEFRIGLITEALNEILEGDIETGKTLLRNYLNVTESIQQIARRINKSDKSIRRMVGPSGNPTLKNFIELVNACKEFEHIKVTVQKKAA